MCIVRRVTVQSGTTSSINTLVPSVTVAKTDDSDGSFCLDAEVRRSRIRHGESSPPESSSRAPPHARRCQVRVDTSFLKGSNVLRLFRVCLSGRDEKSLRAVRQGWKPEGPRPEGAWFTTARPSPRKNQRVETKIFLEFVGVPGGLWSAYPAHLSCEQYPSHYDHVLGVTAPNTY